ncbi:hypothetical protein Pla22_16520 [Rubripirellula amarantea]|uniref:Uncharacterized protein n=1 Tax=Rubripirellula amarantea TaxID=2527999 RepID=A0A5C5WTX2_9BACT|nr:hypothetical protein [Rubripirellula amarantea]TWT54018.1 hypothetical protein Pla22_16520 [Rubripirellula amarantea]
MRTAIHFSDQEMQTARKLRAAGLPWVPMPGQFVLDEHRVVERESPFQDGVFFVLNYEYFMKIAGGEERFRQIMLWLPMWEDCRASLRALGVGDHEVADRLKQCNGFVDGLERSHLYELLLERLERSP